MTILSSCLDIDSVREYPPVLYYRLSYRIKQIVLYGNPIARLRFIQAQAGTGDLPLGLMIRIVYN